MSIRADPSGVSAPKQRLSQKEESIATPSAAKPSAEERQAVTGSSRTRSAPDRTAAFARVILSKIAGALPRIVGVWVCVAVVQGGLTPKEIIDTFRISLAERSNTGALIEGRYSPDIPI